MKEARDRTDLKGQLDGLENRLAALSKDRDAAIHEFNAGFDAAEADRAAEIAGMAAEPDNGDRFY